MKTPDSVDIILYMDFFNCQFDQKTAYSLQEDYVDLSDEVKEAKRQARKHYNQRMASDEHDLGLVLLQMMLLEPDCKLVDLDRYQGAFVWS